MMMNLMMMKFLGWCNINAGTDMAILCDYLFIAKHALIKFRSGHVNIKTMETITKSRFSLV